MTTANRTSQAERQQLQLQLKHQADLSRLYAQYSPREGIQTALILSASLVICLLYLVYKSRCKRTSTVYQSEVIRRSQFDARHFAYSEQQQAPPQQEPRQRRRSRTGCGQPESTGRLRRLSRQDAKRRCSDALWYRKRLREVWYAGRSKTRDWIVSHRDIQLDSLAGRGRLCQSSLELQSRSGQARPLLHRQQDSPRRGSCASFPRTPTRRRREDAQPEPQIVGQLSPVVEEAQFGMLFTRDACQSD